MAWNPFSNAGSSSQARAALAGPFVGAHTAPLGQMSRMPDMIDYNDPKQWMANMQMVCLPATT
jgi:hypothetical protein